MNEFKWLKNVLYNVAENKNLKYSNLVLKEHFLLANIFTNYELILENDFQLYCANKLKGHIWHISGIMSNIDIA